MAEMLIGFVIVGLSVAGLGLGLLCGNGRALRACGQSGDDCACARADRRRKITP